MADGEITKEQVLDGLNPNGVGMLLTNTSGNVVSYITNFTAEGQAPNNLKFVFDSVEIPLDELYGLIMAWLVDEIELVYEGKAYKVTSMQYINDISVVVEVSFIK